LAKPGSAAYVNRAAPVTLGLIADTHGLLRAEALAALAGVDRILHAGDIGKRNGDHAGVLDTLAAIAPLSVVRGNNDRAAWAECLPETVDLDIGGVRVHVRHILADLDIDPVACGVRVVVTGHSHKPEITTRDGVLYVNPGSPGPRRFRLPVSVARLVIDAGEVRAELIELAVG
jgi:putative phosphoesterase